MRVLWRDFLTSLLRASEPGDEADSVTLAIVYLATNGLWQAEIEGVFEGKPELYHQITERLEQFTMQTDAAAFATCPVASAT